MGRPWFTEKGCTGWVSLGGGEVLSEGVEGPKQEMTEADPRQWHGKIQREFVLDLFIYF